MVGVVLSHCTDITWLENLLSLGFEVWITDTHPHSKNTYLFLFGENLLAEADWLLVLIHFVVFLIHPLIEGICV